MYCHIGGVSKAGFYKHLNTIKVKNDENIANEVIKIHCELGFRLGILKTQAMLDQRGIRVGLNKLARIMHEYSLNPQYNRKRFPPEYYAQ